MKNQVMKKYLRLAAIGSVLAVACTSSAIAEDTDIVAPSIGMMGGGCPIMRMGDPTMMGSVMMITPGMMPNGMMGWGPGYGAPGYGAPGYGTGYQGMMGAYRNQGNRGAIRGWPRISALVDGRLAYLKSELNITDAQKDAWTGYADAVRSRVETMESMHEAMATAMAQGTAIDRMNARIQGMETMLGAMKAMQPATERLYKVLNSDQKQLADELIGLDCGGM